LGEIEGRDFQSWNTLATFQLIWEIYYKHCLGGGSLITMLKCTILVLMAAAKVFLSQPLYKHTEERCNFVFKGATPKWHATQSLLSPGKPAFHDF